MLVCEESRVDKWSLSSQVRRLLHSRSRSQLKELVVVDAGEGVEGSRLVRDTQSGWTEGEELRGRLRVEDEKGLQAKIPLASCW